MSAVGSCTVVSWLAPIGCVSLLLGFVGCSSDDANESEGSSGNAGAAGSSASPGASAPGGSGGAAAGGTQSGSGGGGGASGSAMTAAGGVSTNDSPTCTPVLSSCDTTNDCCAGAVCSEGRCRATCTADTDCSTGCCNDDPAVGHKICAALATCEAARCQAEGTECTPDAACCGTLMCVEAEVPDRGICREPCQADGDCASGCCAPPGNTNAGFCAEARACSCVNKAETCSGAILCCEGLACSTFDSTGAFACQTGCVDDNDCADGECCRPINGRDESVCLTGSFCI
jgi:hypothetical protein